MNLKFEENEENLKQEETFDDIYNIRLDITAIKSKKIDSQNLGNQIKNRRQKMESEVKLFSEQEKLFKERTGKDFTTLYQKYYPKLIYFTSRICNDPQKAEDLSTDSFMIALDKIHKYEKEKSQFSTWLFTIAKNLTLQDLKTSKRSISLDVEFDDEGTTMKDFIQEHDEGETPNFEAFDKKAEVMKHHISQLKEPYRTVIEMREIQKMTYKDIADKLGRNLSTIKSQIRNGRHILISQSEKDFKEIDELYM
jgi:RNA polymerase sigma-70 factor (ECF subfamily)